MIFNKFFHFVKGYVIIEVTGLYIERFLYICAKRGIELFNIGKKEDDRLLVCINISDFIRIKEIKRKTKTNIRIIKKCGLPFYIKKLKKRYALLIGMSVFIFLMFFSSLFIWSIEIKGDSEEKSMEVMRAVEKTGLSIGAYKPKLPDGNEMKSIILNNTDNIVWAWVYINGTKATVEFKEGILAPEVVDKTKPCDIIALRDGVITDVVEKNGRAWVKKDDAVLKGDVLIAGTIELQNAPMKTVHAIGDVYATTVHKKTTDVKLYEEIKEETGRKKEFKTLKLFSKCFNLFFDEKVGFDEYTQNEKLNELKIGNKLYLGVGIYKKTYKEVITKKVPISYDIAVEMGRNELEEKIAKELLPGSTIKTKQVEHEKIDDDTVRVSVTMEFTEKIGREIPIG